MTNKIGNDGLFIGSPSRTFSEAINVCFKNYFNFSGRASRSEYWYFLLFTFLAGIFTGFVDSVFFGWNYKSQTYGPTNAILMIVVFIPSLAVTWRRLHDTNKSGWYIGFFYLALLIFGVFSALIIPNFKNQDLILLSIIGIAFLVYAISIFVFLCTKGDLNANRYAGYENFIEIEESATKFIDENDSEYFLLSLKELKENRDEAFWAKCFAESDGDIQKAEARYIKKRAICLKNDFYENNRKEYLYREFNLENGEVIELTKIAKELQSSPNIHLAITFLRSLKYKVDPHYGWLGINYIVNTGIDKYRMSQNELIIYAKHKANKLGLI